MQGRCGCGCGCVFIRFSFVGFTVHPRCGGVARERGGSSFPTLLPGSTLALLLTVAFTVSSAIS